MVCAGFSFLSEFSVFVVDIRQISFGICPFADFPDLGGLSWILLILVFWVYFPC